MACGYVPPGQTRYLFEIRSAADSLLSAGQLADTLLPLDESWRRGEYLTLSLLPQRPGHRAKPVLVYLQPGEDGWDIAGLRRQD